MSVAGKVPDNPTNLDTIVLPGEYKVLKTEDGAIKYYEKAVEHPEQCKKHLHKWHFQVAKARVGNPRPI